MGTVPWWVSLWSDPGTGSFLGNPRCQHLVVFSLRLFTCQRRAFPLLSGACVPATGPFHSCAFCPLHPSFPFIFSGEQTWGPFNSSKVREAFFVYYFFSKLRIPPSCFPVFPYRAAGSRTTVDFSLTSPSLFSTERARRYSRRLSKLQMTRL